LSDKNHYKNEPKSEEKQAKITHKLTKYQLGFHQKGNFSNYLMHCGKNLEVIIIKRLILKKKVR
jgi:hypothetical protein